MDPLFRVEVISKTPSPQQAIYAAMHQDYAESFVASDRETFVTTGAGFWPDEPEAGDLVVKHLLAGNRGHYGCYSADTEVLTESGWVRWDSVSAEMKLLAVDIQEGGCHFEAPSALQKVVLDQDDLMYSVHSAFLDMLVTRDHRMVVSRRKKDGKFTPWEFKPASEVAGKPVRYLLNSCLIESERVIPDMPEGVDPLIAMKMAGFFFGDGVRSRNKQPETIRFRLRRPRKIAYLMSMGLTVDPKSGDRYTVENENLSRWIHKYFCSSTGKTVPFWLIKLPMNLLAAFWDGLKNSDGTRITEKSWAYDSCEKEAIDIIQATAHINGFSANITLNSPNEGLGHENHRPCWRINISENSTRRVEVSQKGRSPGVRESFEKYTGNVYCATVSTGAVLVRRNGKAMVSGNCLEHPQIVLNCGWFPHSTMQQIRTHRVGVSFDVQSFRYTGQRLIDAVDGDLDVEEVFYLRPVGSYSDRQGKKYEYTERRREDDKHWCMLSCARYKEKIKSGFSEEHARGLIPFDVRQHWVMSANARSLMHLLDLRWKADAQLECQQLCDLIWPHFEEWVPAIAEWYQQNRAKKARLAP
jgi:thymidylate synthase (FAD)